MTINRRDRSCPWSGLTNKEVIYISSYSAKAGLNYKVTSDELSRIVIDLRFQMKEMIVTKEVREMVSVLLLKWRKTRPPLEVGRVFITLTEFVAGKLLDFFNYFFENFDVDFVPEAVYY